MLMMIQYESGLRTEAILLAANSSHMRLMTRSHADTLELNNLDGCWRTEQADAIEIEAMIPILRDVSRFCAEIYPRTNAASGLSLALTVPQEYGARFIS